MNRMRLDRERHQDMLTGEMQELRRHILGITHELVEKERQSIQVKLKEIVEIQVLNELDERKAIAGNEVDSENALEETAPARIEAHTTTRQSIAIVNDEQDREKQPVDKLEDPILTPAQPEVEESQSIVQVSGNLDNAGVEATRSIDVLVQEELLTASPQIVEDREVSRVKVVPEVHIKQVVAEIEQGVVASPLEVLEQTEIQHDIIAEPTPKTTVITKPPRSTSGMSWDGILLLVGIMFLAACVVLRVYNINRRKRWFEERRKRRNQRALLLAQRRARAMAESQDDSEEWDDEDTVEEVSLMTPVRDSEDDEAKSELNQSPDTDTDFDDYNQNEEASYSPIEAARTEQQATTTRSKKGYSRASPVSLRQRSPHQRRQNHLHEF
ncbi:Leucine-rich repeat-containing protein 71 [Phytophthora cinnamomi]|uniref:Leucine-rich repeat-containing protein 71 n=1 Tax=Phytophthora cinnamomi TaxID=4785 RepID=UPI00355A5E9E|nr:Leucine-rich repeat-containing protein 71 [Phytophthora cinnamomi]